MTIEEFLNKFVEGYLFHDLESMEKITLPSGQNDGAVGYPMVSTVMAGIELLGNLLLPTSDPFDPNSGNNYFYNYWDNYFAKHKPIYVNLGQLFRTLIRHGVAHTFVAKPGIFVTKGSNQEIKLDATRQELYVDCNVLFNDFKQSYISLVKPLVFGTIPTPSAVNMQARLDSMSARYSADAKTAFDSLTGLDPSLTAFFSSGTRSSGASISLPATTTTP